MTHLGGIPDPAIGGSNYLLRAVGVGRSRISPETPAVVVRRQLLGAVLDGQCRVTVGEVGAKRLDNLVFARTARLLHDQQVVHGVDPPGADVDSAVGAQERADIAIAARRQGYRALSRNGR